MIVPYKYGINGPEGLTELEVELLAFRDDPLPEKGGLGKAEHFWNIVKIVYHPKSASPFVRNPWSERQIENACRHNYLSVLGCASSAKSDTFALWGLVNWACDPVNTFVMVTSTSLKDSRKRIWGRIVNYYSAWPQLPGRLVDSLGIIRTDDGTGVFMDNRGISLIAGEKKKEKEAIGKMIGMKQKKVIMIADELPELSEAILEAAFSNLTSNPFFQLIGIGNFNSMYDALGVFARPKKGYSSVTPEDEEWETEKGHCIRFDGFKSPNILLGEDKYPFLYNSKTLKNHKASYGDDSPALWRMARSFPCPIGQDQVIYNEADIISGKAEDTECIWQTMPTRVSGMDPAFTNGGDRAVQMIGQYGICTDGVWRLKKEKTILLRADVKEKTPEDYQIARQFRDNCISHEVDSYHAALDTTGAGSVLWSIIREEWKGSNVLDVNFSGAPLDMFVRANDTNTAKMQFDRRVSELWWVGREFMKYGQIRGIDEDTARELKARKYDTSKGPEGLKVCVEPKKEMKKRLGFSPDLADCWCVMLDLCRQRLKALAGGVASGQRAENTSWTERVTLANNIYENVDYADQPVSV